jgi:hypothetical protein
MIGQTISHYKILNKLGIFAPLQLLCDAGIRAGKDEVLDKAVDYLQRSTQK